MEVLRGPIAPSILDQWALRYPRARLRKLVPQSCTELMPRRDSHIDGKRYQIFDYFDREPLLADAIVFAKRHGMVTSGPKAYWDFCMALKEAFIEITAE